MPETATIKTDVGKQIKAAREYAGKSQSWLARQLEVAEYTVRRWEAGRATPLVATLGRIAEVLGVSPSWFLMPPQE